MHRKEVILREKLMMSLPQKEVCHELFMFKFFNIYQHHLSFLIKDSRERKLCNSQLLVSSSISHRCCVVSTVVYCTSLFLPNIIDVESFLNTSVYIRNSESRNFCNIGGRITTPWWHIYLFSSIFVVSYFSTKEKSNVLHVHV